jgi:hypothetical protein
MTEAMKRFIVSQKSDFDCHTFDGNQKNKDFMP